MLDWSAPGPTSFSKYPIISFSECSIKDKNNDNLGRHCQLTVVGLSSLMQGNQSQENFLHKRVERT